MGHKMTRSVVYTITFIVCILLQFAIAPAMSIMGCSPLLLLIPVVLVSLHSGMVAGSISGFLLGLVYDFIYSNVVGCMALTFVLLALIIGFLGSNINPRTIPLAAVIAIASAFFAEIVYGFAVLLTNSDATGVISTIFGHSLPSALYGAVFLFIALVTIHLVLEDDGQNTFGGHGGGKFGVPGGGMQFAPRNKRRY